jgi:hypothetical protein
MICNGFAIDRKSYHEPSDTESEAEDEKKPYSDFNIIENDEEVTPLEDHYYKDAFIPTQNTISYLTKSMQDLDNQTAAEKLRLEAAGPLK